MSGPGRRPSRVSVRSVGCRLNQCEAETLLESLLETGCEPSDSGCDICVVNTCTVTGKADRKSRNLIARLSRENPDARMIVTGCYATTDPSRVRTVCPSAVIVPNSDKDSLFDRVFAGRSRRSTLPVPVPGPRSPLRTRPFVKIQDGCNLRCSYCKVWMARGPSRSVPSDGIVRKAGLLGGQGHAEIVLTGVNITGYRDGSLGLAGLLNRLTAKRLPLRFRLASLEPQGIDDDLLLAVSHPSVCDHFHLSLQSGSDEILRLMNRPYSTGLFAAAVGALRTSRPDAGIGADVIVGFPGETEALFNRTRDFLRDLEIPFLHVFPYSDRPGTAAAALPDKIPSPVKMERVRILTALGAGLQEEFRSRFRGRVLEAVIVGKRAITSNYIELELSESCPRPAGGIVRALVTDVSGLRPRARVLVRPD